MRTESERVKLSARCSLIIFFCIAPLLQRFLPATLIVILKEEGAETMLNLFDGESDTPELIWDSSMRSDLRRVVGSLLDSCVEERTRTGVGNESFAVSPNTRVKYQKLDDELFIGGVYVSRFLKEPTYNIRDPTKFLEMLMQRWSHEIQTSLQNDKPSVESHSTALVAGGNDSLQSVTNASVYICKIRSNLCEKLSQWGYMSRCLSFLEDVLAKELYGAPLLSIIRILHVSVNSRQNIENLILSGRNDRSHGIVPFSTRAIEGDGLHEDVAFMLEMMKKLFAGALGDVGKIKSVSGGAQHKAYAAAPSPAPGEGPVSRNRVARGNPLDDPLAMPVPSLPQNATTGAQSSAQPTSYHNPQMNANQLANQSSNFHGYSAASGQGAFAQQSFASQSRTLYASNQDHVQSPAYPYSSSFQGQYQQQSYNHQMQGSFAPTARQQQPMDSHMTVHQFRNQQTHSWTNPTNYYAPVNHDSGRVQSSNWQPQSSGYAHPGYGNSPQENSTQMLSPQTIANTPVPASFGQQQSQQPQLQQYQQPSQRPVQVFSQNQPQQYLQPPAQRPIQQPVTQQQRQSSFTSTFSGSTNEENRHGQHGQQQFQPQMSNSNNHPVSQDPSLLHPAQGGGFNQGQGPMDSILQQQPIGVLEGANRQGPSNNPFDQVHNETQRPSQSTEGSGIDARAALDPKEEAERRTETCPPAPGAVDGRVALLQSAIVCDLPDFIINNVLESTELRNVKDPAAAKVHGVELLKLLTQDPGYGLKFQLKLDENPKWKNYKAQDHSLFITGPDQRADYFLTDGGNGEAKKMLTQG